MTRTNLPRTTFFTSLCLLALVTLTGARRAAADDIPVVEITAKRFAFSPEKVTLKKGQTVKLRLHSEDVTHGFFLRPLKLDEEIPAGQTAEVTITPQTAGTFTTICDHFCGANHGNMNMTIVVE
ncbi:MAG TPA: cupredoxin domain-containing protein [Candidatus Sulfotelmatobacter sp.]|nr:cupredoxin domain-containing protein [Candidatus Sulfotelmatobacter sp.]